MDALFTKMIKSGRTTYFIDVKEAKNNSKYLNITSSSPSSQDPKKLSRRSLLLFANAADEFLEALRESVDHLKQ